jgi:hypothetical protein
MGTTLNKKTYEDIIKEDIQFLENIHPDNSLEKSHIIDVLKYSIISQYPQEVESEVKSLSAEEFITITHKHLLFHQHSNQIIQIMESFASMRVAEERIKILEGFE